MLQRNRWWPSALKHKVLAFGVGMKCPIYSAKDPGFKWPSIISMFLTDDSSGRSVFLASCCTLTVVYFWHQIVKRELCVFRVDSQSIATRCRHMCISDWHTFTPCWQVYIGLAHSIHSVSTSIFRVAPQLGDTLYWHKERREWFNKLLMAYLQFLSVNALPGKLTVLGFLFCEHKIQERDILSLCAQPYFMSLTEKRSMLNINRLFSLNDLVI